MVESGGLSRDQSDPMSQDSHRVSRDSDAYPETDPLEIEIERKLDALFELPSQL